MQGSRREKVSPRRLAALMIKEFYQIIRDPSSIAISIVLPLVLMFLYRFAISLDMEHLRIGLVLEENTPDVQDFAQSLVDSRYFQVKIGKDRREFLEPIIRGEVRGIVVVPQDFSRKKGSHAGVAPIQVIADGSEPNTASFVQNYIKGAWGNWLAQEKVLRKTAYTPLVGIQSRVWYNEELASRYFLIPGSLAIIMTLIGTLLTALVVAREWERGTMEALMATPVTIFELILGKLIPYFTLGTVSMWTCVIIATQIYAVPFRGSFLVLFGVSSVFLLCSLALGLLISTGARNQMVAAQAAMVSAFLPAFILSGFIFEIRSMPWPIRWVTHLIPARYFVSSLQTLFLVGNVPSVLVPSVLWMGCIGLALFFLMARNTVKRLD